MDEHGWLKIIVESMQGEIHEIRKDVRDIKEFKFKVIGGVIAISSVVTILFNFILLLVKLHV